MDPPPNSPAILDVDISVDSSRASSAHGGVGNMNSPATDPWKALTSQALANGNARWAAAATQEEQRKALRRGGSKSLLLRRPPDGPAEMDVDTSAEPSGLTTVHEGVSIMDPPTTDSWKTLTSQALGNLNAKWGAAATQEEQRRALRRGGSKSLLLRRDLQPDAMNARPACTSNSYLHISQQNAVTASYSRLTAAAAKAAKKPAAQPNYASDFDMSAILTSDPSMVRDSLGRTRSSKLHKTALWAAKNRVRKIKKEKSERVAGAKQAARTDALDKAISGLDFQRAPVKAQNSTSSLVLTFPCALTLIEDPTEAQKAYDQLKMYGINALDDASFTDASSNQEYWNLQRLIQEEKTLQFQVATRGPEATRAYQQQRLANAADLAALHQTYEAAAAAAGMLDTDSSDEEGGGGVSLPPYQPSNILLRPRNPDSKLLPRARLTSAVLSPTWAQQQIDPNQRKNDEQTTQDFNAYRNDPDVQLPKKRYKRVQIAMQHGRGDINAMMWEKKQADMVALYHRQEEEGRCWARDM
ncbi:MAG: hypothetical protein Q9174_001873 [Haloplaca sp. 1 TL-2023]